MCIQKRSFSVQAAWHSPNMLPTMVHGQVFHIITWQPPSRGSPYSPPRDGLNSFVGLSSGNLHQYTNFQFDCSLADSNDLHDASSLFSSIAPLRGKAGNLICVTGKFSFKISSSCKLYNNWFSWWLYICNIIIDWLINWCLMPTLAIIFCYNRGVIYIY